MHKRKQKKDIKPIKLQNQKFYDECSTILRAVMTYKSTLRKEIYKKRDPKRYLAVMSQILKYKSFYEDIIKKLNFKAKNIYLSLIYVHEIINDKFEIHNYITKSVKELSKKYSFTKEFRITYVRLNTLISNDFDLIEVIMSGKKFSKESVENNEETLHNEEIVLKNKQDKINSIKENLQTNYIETNETVKVKDSGLIQSYQNMLNEKIPGNIQNEDLNLETLIQENNTIIEKTELENIFRLKIDCKLFNLKAYKEGKIIIQNYSSCLPALILNPLPNSTVIDACAAPGNKTSHLAMIMKNTGMILAYEKNKDRFKILNQMIIKHGVKMAKTFNEDFLSTDSETKGVDYILVDPSCSGSGIHEDYIKDDERIEKLSNFQKKILLHAMRFNGVKSIVYSTCSIHTEENEEVVKYVLERNSNYIIEKINVPVKTTIIEGYEFADKIIRCEKDDENNIQGFFIARFTRKSNIN